MKFLLCVLVGTFFMMQTALAQEGTTAPPAATGPSGAPATNPGNPADPANEPFKLSLDCKQAPDAMYAPLVSGITEIREVTALTIRDLDGSITLKTLEPLAGTESTDEYKVKIVEVGPELLSLQPVEGYVDGVLGTLVALEDIRPGAEALAAAASVGHLAAGKYPANVAVILTTSYRSGRGMPRGVYTRQVEMYCDIQFDPAKSKH